MTVGAETVAVLGTAIGLVVGFFIGFILGGQVEFERIVKQIEQLTKRGQ